MKTLLNEWLKRDCSLKGCINSTSISLERWSWCSIYDDDDDDDDLSVLWKWNILCWS